MTTEALIMMITVQLGVTFATLYFFIKVLKAPKKAPDPYVKNQKD
jgi:heme/copper-type cytochrome/quinol oxidase subunit 2